MSRLTPWESETACTLVCTDRNSHPEHRLGEVDAAGIVASIGGPHGRRQSSSRGALRNPHPEPCPTCGRNIRRPREWWQQTVERARAAGVESLDISYVD